MWKYIANYFENYPKQKRIAQKMLEYGLCIKEDHMYCGSIELSDSKIARALSTDRRAIKATISTINQHEKLQKIFSKLRPTCHLKEMASEMGWDVLEIIPTNANQPGILAQVAQIIADESINIRQAIVDDIEITEEPHLFVVTETRIPPEIIPKIKNIPTVKTVLLS
jgi:predicted regulator of amino acid metabolism with ACT domain